MSGLQWSGYVVFIWFPGGKSGCVLDQGRWNLFGLQHGGFLLCFGGVRGGRVLGVAHSVGVYRRLVLRSDISAVRFSPGRSGVTACLPSAYRHPAVRQDLLRGETAVHIHLQHLADQHLGRGGLLDMWEEPQPKWGGGSSGGTFAGRLTASQSGDGNSSFPLRI